MRARRRILQEHPKLFCQLVRKLATTCPGASLILFGGRARLPDPLAPEPRDYDLLVVVRDHHCRSLVEKVVAKFKLRGLPVDLVLASPDDLDNMIARRMLQNAIVLHDGCGAAARLGLHRRLECRA